MEQKHRIDVQERLTWTLLYVLFGPAVEVKNEVLRFTT